MAGRGKKKRARDDEAGNRGGPGLEQQLEEEHAEKIIDEKGKDKIYREKEKVFFKLLEKFIGEPEIFPKFKDYPAKLIRKITEENPEFKQYEAIYREPGEFKKNRKSWKNRLDKLVKNDGTNEFKDKDTFRHLCGLEMTIGSHAAAFASFHHGPLGMQGGTNAAAGSSVGHTTQSSPNNEKGDFAILLKGQEMFKEFCEKEGIPKKFKAFCEDKVEKQGKFCEELGMVSEALWEDALKFHFQEDAANQHSDEKIQKIRKNFSRATLGKDLQMIPTGGLEGVTAANSSSSGAIGTPIEQAGELRRKRVEELDETPRAKRPTGTSPSRAPIGGVVAGACQNYPHSATAQVTQVSLFSTNEEGTQIQTREAAHDKEATSSLDKLGQERLGEPSSDDELDAFPEVDISHLDISLDSVRDLEPFFKDTFFDLLPDLGMKFTGNFAGSPNVPSNCEGEVQSSTMPMTVGAMNSTGTGEPHHEPLTKQGGTTAAAGSSGGPSTQSSPHKERF